MIELLDAKKISLLEPSFSLTLTLHTHFDYSKLLAIHFLANYLQCISIANHLP